MTATSYLRKRIVDSLTGIATYTPPAALWLSLHKADPGDAGSASNEVTGGGYARVSLAGKMGAADPATGISVNTVPITLGPATSDWGTVNFIGISDASGSGNMLIAGAPSLPKTITVGVPFQIPPGNLRLRLA